MGEMNFTPMNFLCVEFIFMENKNSKCFIKFKIGFSIFYMLTRHLAHPWGPSTWPVPACNPGPLGGRQTPNFGPTSSEG